MNHLILSREFPPATYPRGGIGTYVEHIARLLAERGETVHVIGEQWDGASLAREVRVDGRLIVHRVPLGRPLASSRSGADVASPAGVLDAMAASEFPAQSFAWQAGLLAESLVEEAAIDVIEGQDYEAPLYYFLLRRALGLGPASQPPCFVHLHSPWEFICRSNDWGLSSGYDVTIKRLEDYAIAAADARLCPSRYLAAEVETHYGLEAGSTAHIPYPVGDAPFVERTSETWANGAICYFGRMEPRKGVLEWIEAAVGLAAERPDLRFEFIGADTTLTGDRGPSVRAALEAAVPPHLALSFRFDDALPRHELWTRLARARLVVVPSRWENFALTCVEAMSSGVPVAASPNGGMVEMIEDGRTGWIAATGSPADLTRAVRRALDTPADVLAAMGRAASDAIRVICNNARTVDRQLEFRAGLVKDGARRSLLVPALPSWTPPLSGSPPPDDGRRRREARAGAARPAPADAGIGLVLVATGAVDLDASVRTVERQTAKPASVAIVTGEPAWDEKLRKAGWRRLDPSATVADLEPAIAGTRGVAVVAAGADLSTAFLESADRALDRHRDVAVVSSWHASGPRVTVRPCPALPYQWIVDDTGPCPVFRTRALFERAALRALPLGALPLDEIAVALLADGWLAVTWPAVLSRTANGATETREEAVADQRARLRAATIEQFATRLAEDGPLVVELTEAMRADASAGVPRHVGRGPLTPATILRLPLKEQLRVVRRALMNPRYAGGWLAWHGRRLFGRR